MCEADLSPPTSAEVKNDRSGISTLLCAFMDCTWKNLLYIDDGYAAAADDDYTSWVGKKMDHG